MKIEITKTIKVNVKKVHLKAHVRYWEDATVNDIEESVIPTISFSQGNLWSPIININTGCIENWPNGVYATVNYKVCDMCSWDILDELNNVVLSVENEYVPMFFSPNGNGYGDYIKLTIDKNGKIDKYNSLEIYSLIPDNF